MCAMNKPAFLQHSTEVITANRPKQFKFAMLLLGVFFLGISTACTTNTVDLSDSNHLPTPTLHPFFAQLNHTSTPQLIVTPQIIPTSTQIPPPPILPQPQFITHTVFRDAFDTNWQYLEGGNVEANLASTTHVHNGRYAIRGF